MDIVTVQFSRAEYEALRDHLRRPKTAGFGIRSTDRDAVDAPAFPTLATTDLCAAIDTLEAAGRVPLRVA